MFLNVAECTWYDQKSLETASKCYKKVGKRDKIAKKCKKWLEVADDG